MTGNIPKTDNKNIGDKIMLALLIAFVVPAILTSPFGLYAIVHGGVRYFFGKKQFYRAAKRLERRGYLALTKTDKGWVIKLLKKGVDYAKQIEFENLVLPKPKRWDGKWRLFSFDIPEEYKNARNMIRHKLKSLGCFNIQRSLFAYPHDCKNELEQVAEHYKVTKYTLFAEVTYIDIDKELRRYFKV